MQQPPIIFNARHLALYRNRAARHFDRYDFLLQDAVDNICERLQESSRVFPKVLILGCRLGQLARALPKTVGSALCIQVDISPVMLHSAEGLRVQADEALLPFAPGSFDLIISLLGLHAVSDLPGALIQARKALHPDGVFIATLFGGETLTELRQSFMAVEMQEGQGATPHIFPFVDIKDAGMLMQRAGFHMPVADGYHLAVTYENVLSLMQDLRGMGEGNILAMRKNYGLNRPLLASVDQHYHHHFPLEDGRIKATFELLTLTGMGVPSERNAQTI